ncbi:MAG: stage II sporulation protein M [Candidatus Aenigmatarchaeota archaeon]
MVLESLINEDLLKRNPFIAFLYSSVVSIISVYISYIIFKEFVGIFVTFFISVTLWPLLRKLILLNMKKSIYRFKDSFIERHYETIKSFLIIFFGILFGLTSLFLFLPKEIVDEIFRQQIDTIEKIRGNFIFGEGFMKIFLNNFGVLTLSFILSFIYGGILIVLVWNITILAAAIGIMIHSYGIQGILIGFLTFMPHGIFEFIAYFLGTSAGILLSSYFIKKKFNSKYILIDSIRLYIFGVILLLIGAFIETLLLLNN